MKRAIILLAGVAALAACGGPPRPRIPARVIDRALASAPGEAQPSKIVSAEIAFARMAREEGQWTAFRAFAAPGAMIHGQDGAIPAMPWLAQQSDPPAAVQWSPREIWMSCDGALAISSGRFVDPDGKVGNFLTVWERQGDGEYRWSYDTGVPDDPQPPAPARAQEGDIIVTAMDRVRGHVADCRKAGDAALPAISGELLGDGDQSAIKLSRDGTLAWRWAHVGAAGAGRRVFTSAIFMDGAWQPAMTADWGAVSGAAE